MNHQGNRHQDQFLALTLVALTSRILENNMLCMVRNQMISIQIIVEDPLISTPVNIMGRPLNTLRPHLRMLVLQFTRGLRTAKAVEAGGVNTIWASKGKLDSICQCAMYLKINLFKQTRKRKRLLPTEPAK